jgi:hypothetical protein
MVGVAEVKSKAIKIVVTAVISFGVFSINLPCLERKKPGIGQAFSY